jgi:cytoskeletal protein CcmA (bactofilin family)
LTVTDNNGAIGKDTIRVTVNAAANQAPVANAGSDKVILLPTNSTTLNGSGTDMDGTINNYQWLKIGGPSTGNIATSAAATTAINNLIQGIYQFELTVTDNDGAIGKDTVQVAVNAAENQRPQADAGSDRSITLPTNSLNLSGVGIDLDGTISDFLWTKISGPATGTISSPNAANTQINGLVQGVYQFEFSVTDNNGAISKDTVRVTVNAAPNQAPVANAGANKVITLPVNTTTLTGSGTDSDGTITGYSWVKVSGPSSDIIVSPNLATTAVNNLVQGLYEYELTVTDNDGVISKDTIQVTVNDAFNQAPVANAGTSKVITLPIDSTSLNGSGTDVDGTIVNYTWIKIAGPASGIIVSANTAITAVTNLSAGIYKFELTVTDDDGAISKNVVQVTVNAAPNQAPMADAGPDLVVALPTDATILNGAGTDSDGTITSYKWLKITGPAAGIIVSPNASSTTISGLVQGIYQYQLMVTDNDGLVSKDTVSVTVNAAANQAPIANAGADIVITLPVNSSTLSGTATDPDGIITGYSWVKISGPVPGTIISPNSGTTAIDNLVQGNLSI